MFSTQPINNNNFASALSLLHEANLPTEDLNKDSKLFAINEGEAVIGTIGIEISDDAGLLRSLAVHHTKRNQGLGKELVLFLEKEARIKGLKQLILLTTTAETFFAGIGYEKINRNDVPDGIKQSREFSSLGPSTAVVMRKYLL